MDVVASDSDDEGENTLPRFVELNLTISSNLVFFNCL